MMPSEQITKAIALCQLARYFEAGGVATTKEIAERYEMSQRAVQRWMNDLSAYIVPLVQEQAPSGRVWRRFEG